ncbi:signal peptidase II, partial [Eubacterium sp.]|uniref:signal peptidase II n=1 Tax=Eubacterium sp. TaxID=142586 RepID=UPI002A83ADD9
KNLWLYWSLGVILSGGICNFIYRVRLGYFVDLIEPTIVNFAVFNIADCAVTCGAVSLIAYLVFDIIMDSKQSKEKKNG